MSKDEKQDNFSSDIEMLKYFQDEFQYRHKHYWDILLKFFILTITITILPIISGLFGLSMEKVPANYYVCFPLLGAVVSVFSKFILYDEAKKMRAVNMAKYRINRSLMDPKYHYEFYNKKLTNELSDSDKSKQKTNSQWLSYRLLWISFVFEMLIIVIAYRIICSSIISI